MWSGPVVGTIVAAFPLAQIDGIMAACCDIERCLGVFCMLPASPGLCYYVIFYCRISGIDITNQPPRRGW